MLDFLKSVENFCFDLQLFSDAEGADIQTSDSSTEGKSFAEIFAGIIEADAAQSDAEPMQDSLEEGEEMSEPEPQETKEGKDTADKDALESWLKEVPDKFKNPDGSVNVAALAKSYVNLEQLYSRKANELALIPELQQYIINLQNQLHEIQTNMHVQKPEMPSEEEIRRQEEQFLETFWEEYQENPVKAIEGLVKQVIQKDLYPQIEPIVREREAQLRYQQEVEFWTQQLAKLEERNPAEFNTVLPYMQEIVQELGDSLNGVPNAVEIAYNLAKERQAIREQAQKPILDEEKLLSDEEFLNKLLNNPKVKEKVVKDYMAQLQQEKAPPVIGGQAGHSPSVEPIEIRDTKDAKKATMAYFSRILGKS